MTSVRDLVRDMQREIRETSNLLPDRASELQNKLSALIGNVNDELRESDAEYKRVLLHCLRVNEKANRARIEAETSPAYARAQEAKHTKELVVELIRSLRQYLRNAAEEMRLSR